MDFKKYEKAGSKFNKKTVAGIIDGVEEKIKSIIAKASKRDIKEIKIIE